MSAATVDWGAPRKKTPAGCAWGYVCTILFILGVVALASWLPGCSTFTPEDVHALRITKETFRADATDENLTVADARNVALDAYAIACLLLLRVEDEPLPPLALERLKAMGWTEETESNE